MTTTIGTGQSGSYCYHYKLEIASGRSGTVFHGLKKQKNEESAELVAIKIFSMKNEEDIKVTENEINTLKDLAPDKNVVQVYDFIQSINDGHPQIYLILELCNRGTLEDYVRNNELSDLEIRYLFKQIAEGLKHIHKKAGFLHRDIKPNNILLKDDDIKIADFGEAKKSEEGQNNISLKGTPAYINPQALVGHNYNFGGDIFSLGVTLYFMYFKTEPWFKSADDRTINQKLLGKLYKNTLDDNIFDSMFDRVSDVYISDSAKNLIKNMIQFEENDRYTIEDVVRHPYVNNLEKECIRTPKITSSLTVNPYFLQKEITLTKDEETFKRLFEVEMKKKKIREIMERIYYEREKFMFIHKCMEDVYAQSSSFKTKGSWYELMLVLTRMAAWKSEFFYKYLYQRRDDLLYSKEEWKLFYNSEHRQHTEYSMNNCHTQIKKNLIALLRSLREKEGWIDGLDEKLKELLNPDFKPSLSFFLLLEKVLIQNLISLQDKLNGQPKNEVVIMMYDLMILLTMNQSMKYSRERGFINYEKYLEDKGVGRSVEIKKNRLKIFYSNYLRGPFWGEKKSKEYLPFNIWRDIYLQTS